MNKILIIALILVISFLTENSESISDAQNKSNSVSKKADINSKNKTVPLAPRILYLATRTSPNHKKVPKYCICSETGIPNNCPSDVICKKNPNPPVSNPAPVKKN